jgi:hypothetical protein
MVRFSITRRRALAHALDRHLDVGASEAKPTEMRWQIPNFCACCLRKQASLSSILDTLSKWVNFPSVTEYVRIQFAANPLATLIAC